MLRLFDLAKLCNLNFTFSGVAVQSNQIKIEPNQIKVEPNTENSSPAKMGQTIVRSMSSSTMEQLAEFDSILESKFKSSSPSPPAASLPDVVASTTSAASIDQKFGQKLQVSSGGSNGPTFVIIAPSSSVRF